MMVNLVCSLVLNVSPIMTDIFPEQLATDQIVDHQHHVSHDDTGTPEGRCDEKRQISKSAGEVVIPKHHPKWIVRAAPSKVTPPK